MKGLLRIGAALLAIMLGMNACDVEKEPYIAGADNEKFLLKFEIDNVVGTIDEDAKVVVLDFPAGTDVSHLTPTILVSTYATVEPESGVAQDFSNPVYYTVTAMNGTTAQYEVTAVVHDAENEKSILSFTINDVEGEINEVAKTVTLVMPVGTDVTSLVPTIEVSEGATINPASGEAQDFTRPVTYTVTAQNGTTSDYTVMVQVEASELEPTGKTVLIKDFTGVLCVNCPAAADYAHNLQHQLDADHIIIMGVHAGAMAQAGGQFPNFMTDEGTQWYGNNDSNPLFSVDYVGLTEGHTLYVEQIDAPTREAIAEEQSFEVVVTNDYDEDSRHLQVSVRAVALKDMAGDFYVTACLVEDNIVGWQKIPGGINKEYVFHNVFRGTLNGADGAEFESISVEEGDDYYFQYEIDLNPDYNADECYALVYVYDNSLGGKILQTTIVKIK